MDIPHPSGAGCDVSVQFSVAENVWSQEGARATLAHAACYDKCLAGIYVQLSSIYVMCNLTF